MKKSFSSLMSCLLILGQLADTVNAGAGAGAFPPATRTNAPAVHTPFSAEALSAPMSFARNSVIRHPTYAVILAAALAGGWIVKKRPELLTLAGQSLALGSVLAAAGMAEEKPEGPTILAAVTKQYFVKWKKELAANPVLAPGAKESMTVDEYSAARAALQIQFDKEIHWWLGKLVILKDLPAGRLIRLKRLEWLAKSCGSAMVRHVIPNSIRFKKALEKYLDQTVFPDGTRLTQDHRVARDMDRPVRNNGSRSSSTSNNRAPVPAEKLAIISRAVRDLNDIFERRLKGWDDEMVRWVLALAIEAGFDVFERTNHTQITEVRARQHDDLRRLQSLFGMAMTHARGPSASGNEARWKAVLKAASKVEPRNRLPNMAKAIARVTARWKRETRPASEILSEKEQKRVRLLFELFTLISVAARRGMWMDPQRVRDVGRLSRKIGLIMHPMGWDPVKDPSKEPDPLKAMLTTLLGMLWDHVRKTRQDVRKTILLIGGRPLLKELHEQGWSEHEFWSLSHRPQTGSWGASEWYRRRVALLEIPVALAGAWLVAWTAVYGVPLFRAWLGYAARGWGAVPDLVGLGSALVGGAIYFLPHIRLRSQSLLNQAVYLYTAAVLGVSYFLGYFYVYYNTRHLEFLEEAALTIVAAFVLFFEHMWRTMNAAQLRPTPEELEPLWRAVDGTTDRELIRARVHVWVTREVAPIHSLDWLFALWKMSADARVRFSNDRHVIPVWEALQEELEHLLVREVGPDKKTRLVPGNLEARARDWKPDNIDQWKITLSATLPLGMDPDATFPPLVKFRDQIWIQAEDLIRPWYMFWIGGQYTATYWPREDLLANLAGKLLGWVKVPSEDHDYEALQNPIAANVLVEKLRRFNPFWKQALLGALDDPSVLTKAAERLRVLNNGQQIMRNIKRKLTKQRVVVILQDLALYLSFKIEEDMLEREATGRHNPFQTHPLAPAEDHPPLRRRAA